jgi:hypothetical protein
MVGATPDFYLKDKYLHNGGAILAVIFSQLSIIFEFHLPILSYICIPFLLFGALLIDENKVWWLEIVAFMPIIILLFYV